MAVKKQIDEYSFLAATEILSRLQAILDEKEGVLKDGGKEDGDIEYLHRMRVASRRTRCALNVFEECFAKSSFKKWMGAIKLITKTLGPARDLDVQTDYLKKYSEELNNKKHKRGMDRIILRLFQKRVKKQRKIEKMFKRIESGKEIASLKAKQKYLISQGNLQGLDMHAPLVYEKAAARIKGHLDTVLSYEASIFNPELKEELHEMRKAAKTLRYEMEIFKPVYGDDFKEAVKTVKKIQSELGEIRDCDVWIDFLPDFIEKEEKFTQSFYGHKRGFGAIKDAVMNLYKDRKSTRDKLYKNFLKIWEQSRKEGFDSKLTAILDKELETIASPPAKDTVATQQKTATKTEAATEGESSPRREAAQSKKETGTTKRTPKKSTPKKSTPKTGTKKTTTKSSAKKSAPKTAGKTSRSASAATDKAE